MTRPQMVRADTIDLQDPTSPSAQDHSRKPAATSSQLAPHQASEIRHAKEERTVEAGNLSHSWHDVNGLSDEPPADDGEATTDTPAEEEGADESDDGDEEMVDKMSSSPSISDGGYPRPLWPPRKSSLTTSPSPLRVASPAVPLPPLRVWSPVPPLLPPPVESPMKRPQHAAADEADIADFAWSFGSEPERSLPDLAPFSPFRSTTHLPLDLADNSSAEHHHYSDDGYREFHETRGSGAYELSWNGYTSRIGYRSRFDEGYDSDDSDEAVPSRVFVSRPSTFTARELQRVDGDDDVMSDDGDDEWETDEDWDDDASADSWESQDYVPDDSPMDERFVDSGWGGECLQEPEDIDFEFVYALHTFVATVEGQANAQKGDTMELLDDSNSYWWLVRVVKDSTIGYLPAEHIETPTERLARLNKHRNVDLSQTMLGDTTEKSKNPLKKAIRRRNAKQVTFTAPTYVEASDYDYSSEEDEAEPEEPEEIAEEEPEAVAPLSVKKKEESPEREKTLERKASIDSDQSFGPGRSRNGTVRNTDSFFKDDTVETRKITLTPNLLRDDSSSTSTTRSVERERPSFEERLSSERARDDKKKKEKKGMLSGLFKRKDKKKADESLILTRDASGVRERDSRRPNDVNDSPTNDSEDTLNGTERIEPQRTEPQRTPSKGKLTKSPPPIILPPAGPGRTPSPAKTEDITPTDKPVDNAMHPETTDNAPKSDNPFADPVSAPSPAPAPTPVPAALKSMERLSESPVHITSADAADDPPALVGGSSASSSSDELASLASSPSLNGVAGSFDSASGRTADAIAAAAAAAAGTVVAGAAVASSAGSSATVTPAAAAAGSPLASSGPFPPPTREAPIPTAQSQQQQQARGAASDNSSSSSALSSPSSGPSWSDAQLRAYIDESGTMEIRNLLLVVRDKRGVVPVDNGHALMSGLYQADVGACKELESSLDGLLLGLVGRRRARGRG
ncbi:hypothetical protein EJ06DRAFT_557799 [Trichodelitschia bisporula]|uniref:SH3 domain-containing protein n=1 Tax=Trichodelitschia bisporula TaxID=703511 RepID=A0A6G1HRB4_9PEZI|nr:hypothetical protein EJ06DRAFT_557799 [Trichodelitschia bisporula]